MKIITISGAHSGVGKTYVAERMLKKLKGWSALKVTLSHNGGCPVGRACKACDELPSKFSITSNKDKLEEKGKDTQRLKKAGAKNVLWLRANSEGLKKGLMKAIFRFKRAKGIIIEGNSVLKYLKPDLAIFVKKKDSILKSSARQIINKVDLIIEPANFSKMRSWLFGQYE